MSTTSWNKIFIDGASAAGAQSTFDGSQLGQSNQSFIGGVQTNHVDYSKLQNAFGNGLTQQQIQTIFQTFATITPEEKAELEQLKREYEQSVKIAKLAEFKKLPSELRQFIVNVISWKEAKEHIEATQLDKSDRLKELESKEASSNFGTLSGFQTYNTYDPAAFGLDMMQLFPIPAGISAEELKEAHTEATLEEEILNEEETV